MQTACLEKSSISVICYNRTVKNLSNVIFMNFLKKLFNSEEKELKRLRAIVDEVNAYEEKVKALSDDELRAQTAKFRARLHRAGADDEARVLDELLPEAFATVREAARRVMGQRHYDEQLMGGIVLHEGKIAEMKTGEGKTLTSTLPIYLNALTGKGVHVVTVNDYLARRDANWMGAIFSALGLSTACIMHAKSYRYTPKVIDTDEVSIEYQNLEEITRKEAYAADITYGTNNEFGFDYLRDNMAQSVDAMVQRPLAYAIVDEVDSILIDEARTPLIISAPDTESTKLYEQFARIVPSLKPEKHYVVDEKLKTVTLTDEGIDAVEAKLGVGNIYEPGKVHYVHHLEQAIKAQVIFQKDRDYVVRDGQVLIVDDFTGRIMEGRRYSEGLHQAIEAKEGVTVQKESKTLATITFQNYFRLYDKLAGMTGTAMTSAEEFMKVYNLAIVAIPTHKKMIRKDLPDVVYKTEKAKFNAIAQAVADAHAKGQPVLVGTVAIEKSEKISEVFTARNIPHEVLNAKNHEREAAIIANAGQKGAVTIATNMAGRGTDIKLGEGVAELGGLFIIGTERHEARRIDNQLRGRAGRQGDPGMSQFYVSLEDELMRRFGGDKLKKMMTTLGLPDDEPITNRMIAKAIENAQNKIEGFNFDLRKHVLEYDDVVNKQRETIYAKRRTILEASDLMPLVAEMVKEYVTAVVHAHTVGEEVHWEVDALCKECAGKWGSDDLTVKIKTLLDDEARDEDDKRAAVIELVHTAFMDAIEAKQNLSHDDAYKEQFRNVVRAIMLQTIDRNWMQHLGSLDYLRQGIGLRGYGQRDPLVEYKREAFDMFRGMLTVIRENITETLLKLDVRVNTPLQHTDTASTLLAQARFKGAEETQSFASMRENAQESGAQEQEPPKQQPIIKADEPGRNDPCSCGSGKKYKKCCGR